MRGWVGTLVGFVTLALLVTGGWYLVQLVKGRSLNGEEIRFYLKFSDAHGLPVGGWVRHKGVNVGEVLRVDIAPDDSSVIMEAAVNGAFQHTLRASSRFWIVRPRFGGLSEGVFGLDTLIKDPYIEYDTPDFGAIRLAPGSLVYGRSLPPVPEEEDIYLREGRRPLPLNFKVRFSNAQGLREGAVVLYRDVAVGKVLDVDLSRDGRSVEVEVMIHDRFRETVRSDSFFWVAKPNVQMGFSVPNFFNVEDLSKIITGTALAYATPTKSSGAALKKNDIVNGLEEPPNDMEEFQGPLVSIDPKEGREWSPEYAEGWEPAGISFTFTDRDTLSADDTYFFQGTGLVFRGKDDEVMVLTVRTLADGGYSSSDFLSSPDITDTDLKIRLLDKRIFDASPVWMDPDDRDATLLRITGSPPLEIEGEPVFSPGADGDAYFTLVAYRENDAPSIRSQPIPRDKLLNEGAAVRSFHPDLTIELKQWYGAVLLDGQKRVMGIVGRAEARSNTPVVIVFKELPSWNEPSKEEE